MKYPLNASVKVHYDPRNPGLAVLETKFDSGILIAIAFLAVFACVCGAGFLLGWPVRLRWGPPSR